MSITNSGETKGTVLEGISAKVFLDRYALKDSKGNPLERTPEEMWHRVAMDIAKVESTFELKNSWGHKFYNIQKDFKFIPGGRINGGAGTQTAVSFFNCFVIPQPEDSRGGILDNIKHMTEIMARGGGVGVNLSSLRPSGSHIKSVNGTSSGPVNWAEMYSTMTGKVIQQGGTRRGALMIMLDDDHPDIDIFINSKRIDPQTNKPIGLNFANISIAISDSFMQAVKDDGDWQTQFPTKANVENGIGAGRPIIYGKKFKARDLWDQIATAAWNSAEPGLVFMERYNKQSNTGYYEKIRCVNPCGEQGLGDWQVCNLGAMNLLAYVKEDSFTSGYQFDFQGLADDVGVAIRFLDNVIDASPYFLPENEQAQKGTRRTGLGTMGLADALIKLKIPYGSAESVAFIEEVYAMIRDAAYNASADIAREKEAFPRFVQHSYLSRPFIQSLPTYIQEKIATHGIRNAVLLTQAPTGTTSLLAGVSSGIEPVFSFAFKRVDRTGESEIYHPLLAEYKNQNPDSEIPSYFVSAGELSPERHIAVQSTVQRFTDSSISKTVNGPKNDTVEDVKRLYMLAFDTQCKGVTYYRDGSRDAVLTRIEDKTEAVAPVAIGGDPLRIRPHVLKGRTYNISAPEGTVNITVNNDDDGNVFEVFVNVGKAGSDVQALAEALGRMISLTFRLGANTSADVRVAEVIRQLKGIGGGRTVGFGPKQVRSMADAVANALTEHLDGGQGDTTMPLTAPVETQDARKPLPGVLTGNACPECSQFTLVFQEGCKKCFSCGHSEC